MCSLQRCFSQPVLQLQRQKGRTQKCNLTETSAALRPELCHRWSITSAEEKWIEPHTLQNLKQKGSECVGPSINTISLSEETQEGKPSLTLLNNSLSVFVICRPAKMTLLQMSGEKSTETLGFFFGGVGGGSLGGAISGNGWTGCLGGLTSRERVPRPPSLCEVKFWEIEVAVSAPHKERASTYRWRRVSLESIDCEDGVKTSMWKKAFYKSAMSHWGYLIASIFAHTCFQSEGEK